MLLTCTKITSLVIDCNQCVVCQGPLCIDVAEKLTERMCYNSVHELSLIITVLTLTITLTIVTSCLHLVTLHCYVDIKLCLFVITLL